MKRLLIIGASGHGKVVADIAKKTGQYEAISFYDDDESITAVAGFPCKGKTALVQSESRECDVMVAIGNAVTRERITNEVMQMGFSLPVLVHPQAVVAEDVTLGAGTVVMAGAVINSGAQVGCGVIVNTSSSVDHDCMLEDYVHVSVGSHLAGTVHVGKGTWIGAGAIVNNNINICAGTIIGSGAVVVKNITDQGTYIGVPAKKK